jgi:hypothetical protein
MASSASLRVHVFFTFLNPLPLSIRKYTSLRVRLRLTCSEHPEHQNMTTSTLLSPCDVSVLQLVLCRICRLVEWLHDIYLWHTVMGKYIPKSKTFPSYLQEGSHIKLHISQDLQLRNQTVVGGLTLSTFFFFLNRKQCTPRSD